MRGRGSVTRRPLASCPTASPPYSEQSGRLPSWPAKPDHQVLAAQRGSRWKPWTTLATRLIVPRTMKKKRCTRHTRNVDSKAADFAEPASTLNPQEESHVKLQEIGFQFPFLSAPRQLPAISFEPQLHRNKERRIFLRPS